MRLVFTVKERRLLIPFCVWLGCIGCHRPDVRYEEAASTPPLQKVVVGPSDLVAYPLVNEDWRSLVVLPLVREVRFALTFEQAEKLWGQPTETGPNFQEYHRPGVRIVVAWIRQASGRDTFESWYLDRSSLRSTLWN